MTTYPYEPALYLIAWQDKHAFPIDYSDIETRSEGYNYVVLEQWRYL